MEHVGTFPLPPVSLVLGGARSGKSTHAEKLVTGSLHGASPHPAVYIATAEAGDVEMATRIMAHRARRGVGWTTIEEPLKLAEALEAAAAHGQPVLVDCLTLWLSNLMHAGADVDEATDELLRSLDGHKSPVVFVSNELGLGPRAGDAAWPLVSRCHGSHEHACCRACTPGHLHGRRPAACHEGPPGRLTAYGRSVGAGAPFLPRNVLSLAL
jgi:adenosylcobinamide kinase/adenosylcobinamide-phosphate guanylyltransferase